MRDEKVGVFLVKGNRRYSLVYQLLRLSPSPFFFLLGKGAVYVELRVMSKGDKGGRKGRSAFDNAVTEASSGVLRGLGAAGGPTGMVGSATPAVERLNAGDDGPTLAALTAGEGLTVEERLSGLARLVLRGQERLASVMEENVRLAALHRNAVRGEARGEGGTRRDAGRRPRAATQGEGERPRLRGRAGDEEAAGEPSSDDSADSDSEFRGSSSSGSGRSELSNGGDPSSSSSSSSDPSDSSSSDSSSEESSDSSERRARRKRSKKSRPADAKMVVAVLARTVKEKARNSFATHLSRSVDLAAGAAYMGGVSGGVVGQLAFLREGSHLDIRAKELRQIAREQYGRDRKRRKRQVLRLMETDPIFSSVAVRAFGRLFGWYLTEQTLRASEVSRQESSIAAMLSLGSGVSGSVFLSLRFKEAKRFQKLESAVGDLREMGARLGSQKAVAELELPETPHQLAFGQSGTRRPHIAPPR